MLILQIFLTPGSLPKSGIPFAYFDPSDFFFLITRIFSKSVSQKPLYYCKGMVLYRMAWWCNGKAASTIHF